jgi:RarD protein
MTSSNQNKNLVKGVVYAGFASMLWGFLAVFLKVSLKYIDPITLSWFRFIIALIVLTSVLYFRNKRKLSIIKKPPIIAVIAAVFLGINYVTYIMGINKTSPSNAQVFMQIGPMLLAVAGIFLFKEKLSKVQLFGFLVAIAGFGLFFNEQLNTILLDNQGEYKTGSLLIIGSSISWACFATLQKSINHKYDPQSLNIIHFAIPCLMLLPWVDFSIFQNLSFSLWLLVLFLGVNTVLAYGSLAEAFQHMEANKVAVIIVINPIITIVTMSILSYFEVEFVEPEFVGLIGIIGALLVIFGAILVVLKKTRN